MFSFCSYSYIINVSMMMMMMMMNDGGIQIISKPKLMDFTCHYLVQLSF